MQNFQTRWAAFR